MLNKNFTKIILVALFMQFFLSVDAQTDTTKSDMSLDFGFTRDKNINLWPIVKYSNFKENKKLQILFSIATFKKDIENSKKHSHLFPLWWNDSSSTKKDLRILTTYYPSLIRISKDSKNNFSSFKLFELAPKINLLEVSKSENGTVVKNNFFFFLWYKNNQILKQSYFIIFPFYWSFANDEKTTKTLFPLYSKGNYNYNTKKYFAVTPLFWHFEGAESSRNILFPIFWNKKTGTGEDKKLSNVIFPLFWSHKSKDYKKTVLFPVMWNLKSPKYKSFTFFPFMSKGNSPDNTKKHFAVTPFFWHFKSPENSRNILFPIFWNKKTGTGEDKKLSNVIFPLFWSHKSKDYKRTVLFPIFWNKKTGTGEDKKLSNVIFPLFWSHRSKDYEKTVLFPIIWNLKSPKYKSFTFFPFISKGNTPDKTKKHFAVTPLFWHFKSPESSKNILFPIFWNKKTGTGDDQKLSNVIFPLFWSHKSKDYKRTVLFPIFWNKKIGTGEDKKLSNVIFPLFWSHKSKDYKKTVLFPVMWNLKSPKYKSFTFFPFISKGNSPDNTKKHFAVTPLFWHFEDTESIRNILFPIFWSKKIKTGEDKKLSNVIFPLFWSHKSKNRKIIMTPLFFLKKTETVDKFSILYFLFRKSKEGTRKSTSIFWPICEITRDTTLVSFRFAPILWYKKTKEYKYFSVQPFYYQNKSKEFESYRFLWQLFTYQNYYNDKKSINFLWRTVFFDNYYNDDYEFRILHLLFSNVKKKGKIEKSLFPFFQYSKDSIGNKSLYLFFYFYNSYRQKIPETKEFYQENKIFWFIRFRSNEKWLKKKGIVYTKD